MPEIQLFYRGPFSQFHTSHFTVAGKSYMCAEQYMHEQKARLSGDIAMAARILASSSPHEHKMMGGAVQGFDQAQWDAAKVGIVTEGSRAKFGQNAGLRRRLLDTGDAVLAEANPKDFIWGIGLAETDPDALHVDRWKGQNLLGKILMTVREELRG
jgi:ribA/ribD-fused uncharacterized protein